MCSEVLSPTCFHVLPGVGGLVDALAEMRRCAGELFSPVPSQTTFESFGSITTQQSVKEPPSSKIGRR